MSRTASESSSRRMEWILCAVVAAVVVAGCAPTERVEDRADKARAEVAARIQPTPEFDPSRLRTATHDEIERLGLQRGEYALRVNRTLLYPCQWLRAEDLAETLQPLIQTQFGSGAFIIPHPETNYLFIFIPPLHERDSTRRRATQMSPTSRSTTGRAATGRAATSGTGVGGTGVRR